MRTAIVFLFCFAIETFASLDSLDIEVESQCIQHCPIQNRTDVNHYDYACDYDCNIDQCTNGCRLWKSALKMTCQEACNGTTERLNQKELYCVMGCNDAVTKYFSRLRALLGIPPAPALLADSRTATSLKLKWVFPEANKAGLSCYVQWKYEEFSTSWQYCQNATWDQQHNIFFVKNLQPYTKYRFRIALVLGQNIHHHGDPIVSSASVVIGTKASGVPASRPSNDISPDTTYYMVRNLKPGRNYTIDLSMRNNDGSGPSRRVIASTPPEVQEKRTEEPVLILSTQHNIFELTDILGEPVNLFTSSVSLRGIAIHVSKKLMFVADVDGYVSRMTMKQYSKDNIHILKSQNLNFYPIDLTIDWLNDQLYILGQVKHDISKYIINRCNLDGSGLTVAYAGLDNKPFSMKIDPFSGFLFWVIQGYNNGGLYRLDISDISNGIKHDVKIKKILNETELGAFTIDHTSFNLLVSYQRQNTIKSVTLVGEVNKDLRPVVTHSQLQKVVSLTTANKKFYWTDGIDVFNEEYHKAYNKYFHNTIPHSTNGSYKKVLMNLPSSQPWPVPINPPKQLQAIFGRNMAKTRWQPPELLGIQGKGAWQNWSYEISVTDTSANKTTTHRNINTTFFTLDNLKESTEYILKVAAYTKSGKGPWSSEFQGTTLNRSRNPIILWSAAEGLLQSNAAGENIATVIHRSAMKNLHFTDMTWFKDQIYLVTNDSHVYWHNLSSHKQERIVDLDSVGSIAIDWIGKKLYWSNPKQQLIIRSNLNGSQQEPLLTALAKELNVDSVKAYLYWSTGYKVECAHLNGVDKFEYQDVHVFSGKQVMGVTLDMDQKFVYWIVRGSEGSNLYKAPMQGHWKHRKFALEKVSILKESNIQGPLCYFHQRLLWLQDDRSAAISDLRGSNIATISGKSIWGLNMVYVVDASLHTLPDDSNPWTDINVIPEMIKKSSVKVVGTSDLFNVTWNPITNVNYGTVFYEVQINSAFKNDSTIINTTTPSVKYWREIAPFTALNVTIRAFTYWGTSPQIRTEIYSPPSTPSAPRNLRVYVIHENKSQYDSNYVTLKFRWDNPLHPNGVLQGFKVRCWYMDNDSEREICGENTITMPNQTQYNIPELPDNEIYYFEVNAFTEIGSGAICGPISVNSSHEWPLPTLLVASSDSIFIDDIDANQSQILINDITTPVEIGYLMKEDTLFWINKKQELLMYNLLNSNLTKLFDIGGKSNGLTIDWLERSLYYVETRKDMTGSFVYKVDLNHIDRKVAKNMEIFYTPSNISKIEVSPFTKKLYWIETTDGMTFKLMQSNTDGTDKGPFFSEHTRNRRNLDDDLKTCNCPFMSQVGPSFTVDHSDSKTKPLVIFIDPYTNVVSTDKDGCFCNIVANNTIVSNSFPLDRIKSDFGTLYWTNPSQGLLYALKRKEANLLTKEVKVSDIVIYGNHMQPYPPRECLSPRQHHNFTVTLNTKTASSLNLRMPDLVVHEDCFDFSMATVTYTVFYRKYNMNHMDCSEIKCEHIVTFEKNVEIGGLQPFTKYVVSVAVSNHFTERENILIGPPSIFQTAPGVPSKPRNVSALVLNPTLAKVHWLPPEQLNGLIIYYEVHWQTEGTLSGVRQKGEQPVTDPHSLQSDDNILRTHLRKLSPNETYTVWIRAYSETNESSSDSDRVQITTYPEPSSIVLVNKTAYYMNLSWEVTQNIDNYTVEYTPITSNEWTQIRTMEVDDNVLINVDNLKPKSQYKFRMMLLYENDTELYVWPSDSRFIFETQGDKPSRPGKPIVHYMPNKYKAWWEASKDNGASIELYKLEAKLLIVYRNKRSTNRTAPWFNTAPSIELNEPEWATVYNGTDTSWIISGLNEEQKYAFRVSALNSYGWSDTSEESDEFDYREAARIADKQNPMTLILIATTVPISICLLVILIFSYVICSAKGKQKKIHVIPPPLAPDVELATLRELPRRGIHSTNILYVSTQQAPEEITLLPRIRRDQITLTKFLGSGAFGEVYEGNAKGIGIDNVETKVAVKTLKKGASDQEKTEFLQEAQLMSHFKHEHILQLLGVCLDNDPHFIIMELMLGGDLLTYLRESRNLGTNTPPLTLIELLKMCVDVSKGCKYLEEMHFVHRDLACRNCLVSSIETESRIVKIGDFGLARDIYKNDYYRKEGEGLLPVRWMAPESLVDGVFTSHSDVWAFGVLLWEIMTLGQQPYPARANLEVLHYVRRGGRLGKPTDCPEELHNLMLKCWEFDPETRPSFKYCFEVLENLHRKTLRNPTTGAHEGKYVSTVPERNSWKSETDEEANKEKTPFLPKTSTVKETPKYLELIYDPESELENDGYEVPRKDSLKLSNGDALIKSKDNQNIKDSAPNNNKLPYHNVGNNLLKS